MAKALIEVGSYIIPISPADGVHMAHHSLRASLFKKDLK